MFTLLLVRESRRNWIALRSVRFAPAIAAASIAAIARKVGGLWLGLHGPSLVAPRPETVGSVAACRCP